MTTRTLALDALLTHPRYPELVDWLRAITPVNVVDQADAAANDAHQLLTATAATLTGATTQASTPAQVPDWLRLGVVDALTTWTAGTGSTCPHVPTPDQAQPVLAAAWKPSLTTCTRCLHHWTLNRAAALRCDACGRQCTGHPDDPIHAGMIQLGPMLYQFGTCTGCRPEWTTPTPTPDHPHADTTQGPR